MVVQKNNNKDYCFYFVLVTFFQFGVCFVCLHFQERWKKGLPLVTISKYIKESSIRFKKKHKLYGGRCDVERNR